MLRLALPVMAESLLTMLVGLTDTWLTGQYLGQQHLAAISLMSYALWLLPALFSAVGIGAAAMTARAIGAGDRELADRVAGQSLLIGAVLAALATVVGVTLTRPLVEAMQLHGEAAALAASYLRILVPFVPAIMVEAVGVACLRGAGRTGWGLALMAVVNVVNFVVSAGLVTGWGPFPHWGWEGLAVGAACGYVVSATLLLALLLSGRAGLHLRPRWLRPDAGLARRLLRIGLPGGVDMLSVIGCHLWFLAIINQLGSLASAAHGVAVRIESLAYLPGCAFHVAPATLAGQCLGARDHRKAARGVLTACAAGGGFMVVAGIVFFVAAAPLTRLFLSADQGAVAATATGLLRIVSFGMLPLALLSILSGGLRGAGDTRWPLVITFVGLLGIRVPGAWFLSHQLRLGVRGAWYAMLADLMVRCLLVAWRFWQGDWQKVQV